MSGFSESLRAIADWFDQHPDVPVPEYYSLDISAPNTKESAAHIAKSLSPCHKSFSDSLFTLKREFGAAALEFHFWRSAVCSRRVIEKRIVPERVIPKHEEEVVEWDCEPILQEEHDAELQPAP